MSYFVKDPGPIFSKKLPHISYHISQNDKDMYISMLNPSSFVLSTSSFRKSPKNIFSKKIRVGVRLAKRQGRGTMKIEWERNKKKMAFSLERGGWRGLAAKLGARREWRPFP